MIQYSEKSKEVIKVEQILVQEKAKLEQAKRKESVKKEEAEDGCIIDITVKEKIDICTYKTTILCLYGCFIFQTKHLKI